MVDEQVKAFSLKKARRVALKRFGIETPYPHQERAWKALARSRDVFLVAPTAAGKTLAFQVPGILREGLAVVVSPLVALMREQTDKLKARGVKADRLGYDLGADDLRAALGRIHRGETKVVYVSPERLKTKSFGEAIQGRQIGTIAVDECHCLIADTTISTPDGGVPIQHVRVGDTIWSAPDGDHVRRNRVTKIMSRLVQRHELVTLQVDRRMHVGTLTEMTCTTEHPIGMDLRGYKPAGFVYPGEGLLVAAPDPEHPIMLTEGTVLNRIFGPQKPAHGWNDYVQVFNLTCEPDHSYFANGILTHNCFSKWGKDFRPAYAAIEPFAAEHPEAATIAVTATADEEVEREVTRALGMVNYRRIVGTPNRPNLNYRADLEANVHVVGLSVDTYLEEGGAAIIYCASRKRVEDLARDLGNTLRTKRPVRAYHAGLPKQVRHETQDYFMSGDLNVVVSTNAFGMGVDRPDVRLVYHWDPPDSVFSYAQESGRAGRDGKEAYCILNLSKSGSNLRRMLNRMQNPPFWCYERLWRSFLKLDGVGIYKESWLNRIARGQKMSEDTSSAWMFQALPAMRYLEHLGAIRTAPGGKTLRVVIRENSPDVIAYLDREGLAYEFDPSFENALTITVGPEQDPYGVIGWLLQRRLIYPSTRTSDSGYVKDTEYYVERLARELPVTEKDIVAKADKAEERLNELFAFVRSNDQPAFLERVFVSA